MNDTPQQRSIDITVETSEDMEVITLSFTTKDGNISVGFALPEAQML